MTATAPRYAAGWLLSVVMHVSLIAAAMIALSDLHLAPQSEPFRWDVALLGAAPSTSTDHASGVQGTAPSDAVAPDASPSAASPPPAVPARAEPVEAGFTHAGADTRSAPAPRRERSTSQSSSGDQTPQAFPPTPAQHSPKPELTAVANATTAQAPEAGITAHERVAKREQSETPSDSERTPQVTQLSTPAQRDAAVTQPASETREDVRHEPVQQSAAPPSTRRPEPASSHPGTSAEQPATAQHDMVEAKAHLASQGKPDYGWLGQMLASQFQAAFKYPPDARLLRLEGRVVLRVTVKETGELIVEVQESSGHQTLDQAAIEAYRRLSPIKLDHPLGRSHVRLLQRAKLTVDDQATTGR